MLCLGSIEMVHLTGEPGYKETILQRNDRKMTISWSVSYNFFVKFNGKKIREPQNAFSYGFQFGARA